MAYDGRHSVYPTEEILSAAVPVICEVWLILLDDDLQHQQSLELIPVLSWIVILVFSQDVDFSVI
ncbi:MAG: hypothetical protein IGNPGNKH_00717 [Sodalis sp. Ffu]|nr:MAG: hypothetical protein IGNPGNKH_00717 [Sodalis sp. Ffu]